MTASAMHPLTAFALAAALRASKTHVVLSTYADGTVHRHETASAAQAENWATGERRLIGRDLISRKTGLKVRVVSVEIVKIGEA